MESAKPNVFLYDTTLRDGTQGEGISFTVSSKVRLAEKLDSFGIDYIEGGWPGSNPRDMAFFDQIRKVTLKRAKVAAFGSTRRASNAVEVDPQVKLLLEAETPVVTIFGKTWLMHVTEVLRTTAEENIKMIEDTVRYLKDNGREVVYDAEHFFDGYKDNPKFALATLEAAQRGGAEFLTLCDTNGGTLVGEVQNIVGAVQKHFPKTKIGMHCHNDAGLGVAVTLAGVEAGAVMVQGTMNGYGERIGNANLTTVIPNLSLKMGYPMACAEHISRLRDLSLFTAELANQRHDSKQPYVGASAFVHKGGVHADAVNKVKHSYEHIAPEAVGNRTRVVVSDMSGRASIMMKAQEMGLDVESKSPAMTHFLDELKQLEFRGYEYEAADASFKLLIRRYVNQKADPFKVLNYKVIDEYGEWTDDVTAEATVKVKIGENIYHVVDESTGPVGALDGALRKALSHEFPQVNDVRLTDFKVRILDGQKGVKAIIRVQVESTDGVNIWGTVGASDDIIEASLEALRDAFLYKIALDHGETE
ncbi:citramalate synthase [Cerasicoccus arenae]|nr:citramalate synthase [Cerasicoccus arenae]MBK1856717.1 citramalate synthase [Cerasicoccus arenae]